MMRTFAPADAPEDVPAGWGVRRAARLAFPGPAALSADPGHTRRLRVYLTDMLHPYGLALDEAALERDGQSYGSYGSYGEMAEALIGRTVPPGESVDLLVLAYAVPDITPGRATTARLSHVCPGTPMAFAVTDQGPAAAFTALRLIRAYAGGAGLHRALLLVVEQPSLPYDPGVPVTLPAASYGVALLLGPPVPPERPTALGPVTTRPGSAADAFAALGAAPGPVTAILGPTLAPTSAGAHRFRTADPGRPTTGVWWELAAELATATATPHRLVLADHDPVSGATSLAVFDTAPEPRRTAAVPGRLR